MRYLVVTVLAFASASASGQSLRRTPVVEVVERVRPTVVNLTAEQVVSDPQRSLFEQFFGDMFPELGPRGRRYATRSLGSGVVVSMGGLVVTNEHVIEGAAEIKVRFADGDETAAEVVGSDADADLALLKVPHSTPANLPVAREDDLMIGETVIAIGNPLGLENTVTVGVLSARDRTVRSPKTNRIYTDFLQIDASVNPGNSGGALVDLDGRLIGINTAIIGEAQGIGFAIPAKRVRRIVQDLLRYGEVQPAWLGLFVRSRGLLRAGRRAGVEVVSVVPGSPASRAGIPTGAILGSANRRPLGSRDDYGTVLDQLAPGDSVVFDVVEDGSTRRVTLVAERPPADVGEQILSRFVGIEIRERGGGVVVSRAATGSAAGEAGLAPGDVVLQVNRERISSIDDVNRVLARDHTRSSLLLVIRRGRFAYNLTFPLFGEAER